MSIHEQPHVAPGPRASRQVAVATIAVGLIALLLREYFILVTEIGVPVKGDVRDYLAYARNLLQHGVFAMHGPGQPDAYRPPAYPVLLALMARLAGETGWYAATLHLQAALGAASVVLAMLLSARFLRTGAMLGAGLALAFWPHHIAFTAALLSEVLFGFLVVLAAWLTIRALERPLPGRGLAAGTAWAAATLCNPVVLFLPVFAGLWLMVRSRKVTSGLFLAAALVPFLAWESRNAQVVESHTPGRATINFVQGSWPDYHRAAATRHLGGESVRLLEAIRAEIDELHAQPRDGLKTMASRLTSAPTRHLRWYLIEKPWHLWDWDLRAGVGDVYFHAPVNSPLETHLLLQGIKRTLAALNPAIFVLSLVGVIMAAAGRAAPGPEGRRAAMATAVVFVYVTAVHVVFQSEPRYGIPFRWAELLLATVTLQAGWSWATAPASPATRGSGPARHLD